MGKGFSPPLVGGSANVGYGSGIQSISFDLADQSSMLWLRRSMVGRWRLEANLLCIKEDAMVARIDVSVAMVDNTYGLISFNSFAFRDCALGNNLGLFSK